MLSHMSVYTCLAGARRTAALVGLVAAAALLSGTPADAAGRATHGHPHLLPTVQAATAAQGTATATSSNTLVYHGGPVITGKAKVYLIFWGTQWGTVSTDSNGNLKFGNDTAGAAGRVQQLVKGLGTGGEQWSGVLTQYCSGVPSLSTSCPSGTVAHIRYPTGGGTLAGVWYDNRAAAPRTASEPQIGQEAVNAAGHFGNTTTTSNQNTQYVIFSAKGTDPDSYQANGFCAWHDSNGDLGVSSPYGDIALTNLPYLLDVGASCGENFVNAGTAGSLDGFSIVEGHEYAETLTDPDPFTGWVSGNISTGQRENADECAWISSGQGAAANVQIVASPQALPRLYPTTNNLKWRGAGYNPRWPALGHNLPSFCGLL